MTDVPRIGPTLELRERERERGAGGVLGGMRGTTESAPPETARILPWTSSSSGSSSRLHVGSSRVAVAIV